MEQYLDQLLNEGVVCTDLKRTVGRSPLRDQLSGQVGDFLFVDGGEAAPVLCHLLLVGGPEVPEGCGQLLLVVLLQPRVHLLNLKATLKTT